MNYARRGGAEIYIYTLISELKKRGIHSEIISGSSTKLIENSYRNHKCHFVYIDKESVKKLPFIKRVIWNLRYIVFLYDFILRLRVLLKADYFVCQQPWPSSFAMFCGKILRKKVIIIVHHIIANEFTPLIMHQMYSSVKFIAVTEEVKDHLIDLGLDNNISVLPNPIELHPPIKRTNDSQQNKDITISLVSHVYEQKASSLNIFCNIAKRFPNYSFQIIGECTSHFAKNLIERFKGDVSFRGLMNSADLQNAVTSSDVVVGVGRSALEAIICGKKVIISGHVIGKKGGNFGGLVNEDNISEISSFNYSGRNSSILADEKLMEKEILKAITEKNNLIDSKFFACHSPALVCQNFVKILKY